MDDPSPDPDTRSHPCLEVGCLIVVVIAVVLAILSATGVCVAA